MNVGNLPSRTVLIVEDDPVDRQTLVSIVKEFGLEPEAVNNYLDTFNILRNLKTLPILAIVDLVLKNDSNAYIEDGVSVLEILQDKGIYAIICSNYLGKLTERIRKSNPGSDLYPAMYRAVDKAHFKDKIYIKGILLETLGHAESDLSSEGRMPEQRKRFLALISTTS